MREFVDSEGWRWTKSEAALNEAVADAFLRGLHIARGNHPMAYDFIEEVCTDLERAQYREAAANAVTEVCESLVLVPEEWTIAQRRTTRSEEFKARRERGL